MSLLDLRYISDKIKAHIQRKTGCIYTFLHLQGNNRYLDIIWIAIGIYSNIEIDIN